MNAWPDRRILDLFGIESPIILAPMAGPGTAALAIAVSEAGGLGSLPRMMSATSSLARSETKKNADVWLIERRQALFAGAEVVTLLIRPSGRSGRRNK